MVNMSERIWRTWSSLLQSTLFDYLCRKRTDRVKESFKFVNGRGRERVQAVGDRFETIDFLKGTKAVCEHSVGISRWPQFTCFRLFSTSRNGFTSDEDFIKNHTVISNDHLTPELSLRLITPKCELWYTDPKGRFQFENDPFWAIYWPGGQALSRYILDNQAVFKGKNVIDIGSGSGACAIAAAKSGAQIVVANDTDGLSLKAVMMNAELNNVDVFVEKENLIGKNIDSLEIVRENIVIQPKWDVVLVGDMFYDTDFSAVLFQWLTYLNSCGKSILIGDPGRHGMKDLIVNYSFIKLADYPVKNDEHYGFSTFSVWKVR